MSTVLAQIRSKTVQGLRAASHERARGFILDIQEIVDENRKPGSSPEPAAAAMEVLVEEFEACYASADPRAPDVLIEAINNSLQKFGLHVTNGDGDE